MNHRHSHSTAAAGQNAPAWGAVVSMMLGVFGMVTAEFLPASLLTPMAADLGISEGLAGQAVSATAVLAFVTSLLISSATRRIDRRYVLLGFSVLLIISNLLVAYASNLAFLLLGRVFLGIALGGFWTMSAATIMRLVPESLIPRGLSIMLSGVSAATIFAAPVGSYLGGTIGWRNVFLLAAVLGFFALAVQFATLPRMAPRGQASLRTLFEVMVRPRMKFGMVAVLLIFSGHFALFTYVRPFLEDVTGVAATGVSAILLGFGVANFAGAYLGGLMLERNMRLTLAVMPLVMGIIGFSLASTGSTPVIVGVLIAFWGLAFGTVPVAWSTWITRTVPDEAESGGGLLVAAIQLAIAFGASAGGALLNFGGVTGVFSVSGLVLMLAALFISLGLKAERVPAKA
ncbi:Predicted arabinose efflux permease, MFS family [Modicisalibacter muralis]|uniref:Predicted arabinose efflux permease, MFS family n=1 Tax=Modicisalibacter muralis TaxID=119000 RepID=A0A1G9MYQ0_9GAMM|nr:MFS transporter [Halomonas muralis]SDL79131.1 Predicted arabinose efflux permease, MFS family [Halomonas muralis]